MHLGLFYLTNDAKIINIIDINLTRDLFGLRSLLTFDIRVMDDTYMIKHGRQ